VVPLSPLRWKDLLSPSMRTASLAKRAFMLKGAPVRFWQARQWQIEMRKGSPSQVTRNCPQAQEAVRSVIR
jgi:hypothetical protein